MLAAIRRKRMLFTSRANVLPSQRKRNVTTQNVRRTQGIATSMASGGVDDILVMCAALYDFPHDHARVCLPLKENETSPRRLCAAPKEYPHSWREVVTFRSARRVRRAV